ncbi:MAG: toll/interleukin-1 receptor domain-containing protein, partial [Saprospiraceae bacterium]|nr:toll/interleukin-1 receptor domain-containing protein [Saprospiraceae bacterium]
GLVSSSSPTELNPDWSGDSRDFMFWTQLIDEKVPMDLWVSIDDPKVTSVSYFVNILEAQSQHNSGQHLIRGVTLDPGNQRYKIYKSHQFSPFLRQVVKQPKKVFLSYSHDDMRFKIELQKYLINLERQGLIEIWQDGLIQAGDDWDNKIRFNLENADIVILLVSQNFIASNYIHEIEFRMAMTNRAEKDATVLPILLSDCDWQHWSVIPENLEGEDVLDGQGRAKSEKISNLQFMPINDSGRLMPVVKWDQETEAWARVVGEIRGLL